MKLSTEVAGFKLPASINFIPHSLADGRNNIVSTRIELSPATVRLIPTKLASQNSNACRTPHHGKRPPKKSLAAARSSLAQSAGQFKEVMLKLATQPLSGSVRLPVAATIETLALSRATHYRQQASLPQPDPDTQLRDQIRRVALDWPWYGYRRISAQLHRQGITANHKRVLRLMREDNLLCLRKRRFISTTGSTHGLSIYPNQVADLTVCSINQLWVAEIV